MTECDWLKQLLQEDYTLLYELSNYSTLNVDVIATVCWLETDCRDFQVKFFSLETELGTKGMKHKADTVASSAD